MKNEVDPNPGKAAQKKKLKGGAVNVLIVIAIFGFGWAVGSGSVSFRKYGSQNASLPNQLDYSTVDTLYKSLKENYDGNLDQSKLIEGLKSGLVKAAGDPYTEYMDPNTAQGFSNDLEGKFEGIGAELGKDPDDNLVIISPIAGYPAEKAGVKPKDLIAEIDGESTSGLTISEAVKKIRGTKGTTVTLTVVRDGEIKDYTITREEIDIPSVKHEIKDGVGIMTISRFGDDTVELASKAAEEFASAKVSGIVLDLRGNTGGYLSGAVDVSSLWLDKNQTILTERRGDVVVDTFKSNGQATLKGIKTVVLINEGSASASEIVSGALKDNNAAKLVGLKTYGKGSVQQPIKLDDGGLLKVTIARWFTPNGKNIDKEGIEPDQKVDISADDIKANKDPQLEAALQSLK